jgi:hypothetical protein
MEPHHRVVQPVRARRPGITDTIGVVSEAAPPTVMDRDHPFAALGALRQTSLGTFSGGARGVFVFAILRRAVS